MLYNVPKPPDPTVMKELQVKDGQPFNTLEIFRDRFHAAGSSANEWIERPANFGGVITGFPSGLLAGFTVLDNNHIQNLKSEYGNGWHTAYESGSLADTIPAHEMIAIEGGFALAATAVCVAALRGLSRFATKHGITLKIRP